MSRSSLPFLYKSISYTLGWQQTFQTSIVRTVENCIKMILIDQRYERALSRLKIWSIRTAMSEAALWLTKSEAEEKGSTVE